MDKTLLQGLALLETRDGQKTIKGPNGEDSFNLFNIKDFSGKGFRAFDKAEGSRDAYRVYGSREESIQDLVSLLERKYPDAHKALQSGDAEAFATGLKKGGYATDPVYVDKLTKTIASVRKKQELDAGTSQAVASSVATGEGPASQLAVLRKAGFEDIIDDGLAKGYKPEEIVAYLASAEQQRGADARATSQAKGALGRAGEQFTTGIGNIGRSLSRVGSMVSGDQEALQRKLAEQAAIDNDLVNIADRSTGAGAVGGFVGDNAAALIPVPGAAGAGLVGRLALQGAASGGAQGLTTSRSDTLSGVLGDTAGGAAVGALGGGAVGGTLKGLGRAQQFASKVKNQSARLQGVEAEEIARISQEAGKRVGVETTLLDPEYVAKAQPILGKRLEDAMDGVAVRLDGDDARQFLDFTANRRLPRAYREEIDKLVVAGRQGNKAIMRTEPVSVKELDNLRRAVGKDLTSPSLNAFERDALSMLEKALGDKMQQAFATNPEKQAAFAQAKQQYDHFRVVRDLVANTNGDVKQLTNATKWASAQKRGSNRSRFAKGDAPFQDITELLQAAKTQERMSYGPLGRAANKAIDLADYMPVAGPLGRILGFRDLVTKLGDPKVRAAFEQLDPVTQSQVLAASRQ